MKNKKEKIALLVKQIDNQFVQTTKSSLQNSGFLVKVFDNSESLFLFIETENPSMTFVSNMLEDHSIVIKQIKSQYNARATVLKEKVKEQEIQKPKKSSGVFSRFGGNKQKAKKSKRSFMDFNKGEKKPKKNFKSLFGNKAQNNEKKNSSGLDRLLSKKDKNKSSNNKASKYYSEKMGASNSNSVLIKNGKLKRDISTSSAKDSFIKIDGKSTSDQLADKNKISTNPSKLKNKIDNSRTYKDSTSNLNVQRENRKPNKSFNDNASRIDKRSNELTNEQVDKKKPVNVDKPNESKNKSFNDDASRINKRSTELTNEHVDKKKPTNVDKPVDSNNKNFNDNASHINKRSTELTNEQVNKKKPINVDKPVDSNIKNFKENNSNKKKETTSHLNIQRENRKPTNVDKPVDSNIKNFKEDASSINKKSTELTNEQVNKKKPVNVDKPVDSDNRNFKEDDHIKDEDRTDTQNLQTDKSNLVSVNNETDSLKDDVITDTGNTKIVNDEINQEGLRSSGHVFRDNLPSLDKETKLDLKELTGDKVIFCCAIIDNKKGYLIFNTENIKVLESYITESDSEIQFGETVTILKHNFSALELETMGTITHNDEKISLFFLDSNILKFEYKYIENMIIINSSRFESKLIEFPLYFHLVNKDKDLKFLNENTVLSKQMLKKLNNNKSLLRVNIKNEKKLLTHLLLNQFKKVS